MAERSNRRAILIVVVILVLLLLLLLGRCMMTPKAPPVRDGAPPLASAPSAPGAAPPAVPAPGPQEALTPATVKAPAQVVAGGSFQAEWTGPDNRGDYLTIVRADAPPSEWRDYLETGKGPSLTLTAPIEPGTYEVRYITAQSRTVLGKATVEVVAAGATLEAPATVVLGSAFTVKWTGPGNTGDFVTIVAKSASEEAFGSYVGVEKGSSVSLTAPPDAGEAEIRYVTGQGRKVLARRAITVAVAEVSLTAPAEAVAGATVDVAWTGPNNVGDYVTVVEAATPDGKYGNNYLNTSQGSPLKLQMPVMEGKAELRYMTGQGGRVLARRAIMINAAVVTLAAPATCKPDEAVSVEWTGPNNRGDYITIVAKAAPDSTFGAYTNTTSGSPLKVKAPKLPGDAEIRYIAGQGGKVLKRLEIKVAP